MEQNLLHWSNADPIELGMLIEINLDNDKSYILVVNKYNQIISLQGSTYNNVQDLLERNSKVETICFRTVHGDWSQLYSTKKPKETYRVGQRIVIARFEGEYIIARTGYCVVTIINLTNGNYFGEGIKVKNSTEITTAEMLDLTNQREFKVVS